MIAKIPNKCLEIIKVLNEAGHKAYLVGGSVRDMIMGNIPHDFDITTSATPSEVIQLFDKTIPTGIDYGTITVMFDDVGYEVTTFRKDQLYSDGRRPDSITFSETIEDDLARRDFTINAIAYNPFKNVFIDPFNGINDIKNKVLKAVGKPDERIKEDSLRILRGYRFAVKYHLEIEEATLKAMKDNLLLINKNISKERINCELLKILECSLNMKELNLLWDVFTTAFPVLKETEGYEQKNPHHDLTLDKHILVSISNVQILKTMNIDCFKMVDFTNLKLALLLHDIGKIHTQTFDANNVAHYYGHAEYSGKMAREILKELKFSNSIVNDVVDSIEKHQIVFPQTKKNMVKFINKNGLDNVYKYLAIYCADKMSHRNPITKKEIDDLLEKIKEAQLEPMSEFGLKDLAINGFDVINSTNYRNKEIGIILNATLNAVLDGVIPNTKKNLIEFIKKYRL